MPDTPHWIEDHMVHAGGMALNLFGQVIPSVKNNASFVTKADLEVQNYLISVIRSTCPEDGIIAEEEGVSIEAASGDRTWIIDPIDGTSSFVRGFPTWGIAVGVAEGNTPAAGFFYMPMTGDFFKTGAGQVVLKNGQEARPRALPNHDREAILLVDSKFHRMFDVGSGFQGKIRSLGSASAHMSYVATGSADAVLVPDLPVWDLATGLALMTRAGCAIQYYDGSPVEIADLVARGRAPQPLICGNPGMIEGIRASMTLRG